MRHPFALLSAAALFFVGPACAFAAVRVEVKDAKGAPVRDAVASLTPLDREVAVTPPATPVEIVQENEEFSPYVTAVVTGTRVAFPNQDKVLHHVYSLSKPKRFELPLYRGRPHEPVAFDQPGVVTLGCNIHDWMAAYIVVLATPHFAKSGQDGLATVGVVPAGRYRLEVWHPRAAAVVTREVTVADNTAATQTIAVTLRPDRRIRRAPEASAGGYK